MRYTVVVRAGAKQRSLRVEEDGTIRIRTTIAPEKGKANKDVVDMLADHFNVARSSVEIISGHGASRKIIEITA